MPDKRISVRLGPRLDAHLRRRAAHDRKTESALVREALESYLLTESTEPSAYDIACRTGMIGRAKRFPKDLSTNPKYLSGLGRGR
jgi:hypothetical protein